MFTNITESEKPLKPGFNLCWTSFSLDSVNSWLRLQAYTKITCSTGKTDGQSEASSLCHDLGSLNVCVGIYRSGCLGSLQLSLMLGRRAA